MMLDTATALCGNVPASAIAFPTAVRGTTRLAA